ncbi:helix-turn-helix domain-containing protein [Desulfatiferula olefinivorans]
MGAHEFVEMRKRLNKTQKEMALLLGVSLKAVHSYEQGWRSIPDHVKRQLFFLATAGRGRSIDCWTVTDCPEGVRDKCPAYEFRVGSLCWFINGTLGQGRHHESWDEKIKQCKSCVMFADAI